MENKYNISSKWSNSWLEWVKGRRWRQQEYPTIRLCCAEARLPRFVRQCAVTMQIRQWLQWVDWNSIDEQVSKRFARQNYVSRKTYIAAFLVKIDQEKRSLAALHRLLVTHPALVWGLGFPLVEAKTVWGFDPQASVPCRDQLSRVLRRLPNDLLQKLMDAQVKQLKQMLPEEFGRTVSIDTKHIIAWVKENNPKAYIKEGRYDKTQQPSGDADCRLGVKRRFNIKTPRKEGTSAKGKGVQLLQLYWGYASGAVVTKVPKVGEFVLAETTRTFNDGDTRHFFPLMSHVERRLGFRPTYAAADAAFDAFYIYDYFHRQDEPGFAAVPLSAKGRRTRTFNVEGLPLCDASLPMPVKKVYTDNKKAIISHRRAIHGCPLLIPEPNGTSCPVDHKQWPKGGCTAGIPVTAGPRLRVGIDRTTDLYKSIFKQRTAVERIFAQATHLGIERPKLRNKDSIANQNTLIYLLINVRAMMRVSQNLADLSS